ncbi:MAG: MFS transporter, partial [Gammaproteobacteria bacterium]|nr:MFS transporter [Gammaproteobacteria bacterium]
MARDRMPTAGPQRGCVVLGIYIDNDRLSLGQVIAYAHPTVGVSLVFFLLNLYFFKYATDVLYIAPATMGILFGLARGWDAISDPMAGYLSDRTRSRMGRRRPWLYASVLPMAVVPVMLWSPPDA